MKKPFVVLMMAGVSMVCGREGLCPDSTGEQSSCDQSIKSAAERYTLEEAVSCGELEADRYGSHEVLAKQKAECDRQLARYLQQREDHSHGALLPKEKRKERLVNSVDGPNFTCKKIEIRTAEGNQNIFLAPAVWI